MPVPGCGQPFGDAADLRSGDVSRVGLWIEADRVQRRGPGGAIRLQRQVAESIATAGHAGPLLLFCFPGPGREQAARRALAACDDAPALRIATIAIDPEQDSPAGPVWLPLLAGWPGGRVALWALDSAIPDPWQDYRAEREREREQGEQGRRQAQWASDADGPDGQDDDGFPLA